MATPAAPRSALVAGGSIAGPALAYWLCRHGWDVTVVERAAAPRTAGQNVDVRGVGAQVLERIGIRDAVLARRTGEVGTAFIGLDGRVAAAFPADGSDIDGATAELEVLRGDLSALIVEQTDGRVEYVYGDTIASVEEHTDGVTVHLAGGTSREVDVVVAADGLNSSTRAVLGLSAEVHHLGLETSYFTIPRTDADDDWWRWYNPGGGRSVHLRPDPYGSIRATLNLLVPPAQAAVEPRRSRDDQMRHLRATFADVGWHTPRVLDGLTGAEDLYSEHLGQVRGARWSRGRAVLVGDAAHCASPLSGMGTTLALTGAYVLAGELATGADRAGSSGEDFHTAAFARYDALMRPFVERAQKLPPGGPRLANPRTRAGVTVFNGVVKVLASRPLRRLGDRLASRPADAIDLPDYARLLQR